MNHFTRRTIKILSCLVSLLLLKGAAVARTEGHKRTKIDTIIIHAIGEPQCTTDNNAVVFRHITGNAIAWKKYFDGHDVLGIHWIIDRSGTTVSSISEAQVANHAKGANQTSIGIELVNNGDGKDPFPKEQIEALKKLIREIRSRWTVPIGNIKRHSDVDRGPPLSCGSPRKVDPGAKFPFDEVIKAVDNSLTN